MLISAYHAIISTPMPCQDYVYISTDTEQIKICTNDKLLYTENFLNSINKNFEFFVNIFGILDVADCEVVHFLTISIEKWKSSLDMHKSGSSI